MARFVSDCPLQYMFSIKNVIKNSLQTDLSGSKVYVESDTESTGTEYLTVDEKKECVLNDPKFGMFSMFKYAVTHKKTGNYCSEIFTPIFALPLLLFVSQWVMFVSIVIYQYKLYENGACPQSADIESKMLMFAVSLLYFVNSFFLWDEVVDRTHKRKMIPAVSAVVLLDLFQEFSFSLFVYISNLLIILVTDDVPDMLFNCLALEFVMSLDNEFERVYFEYNPEAAVDIYDNLFVHKNENKKLVQERMKSTCYCVVRYIAWIPFKILTVLFMLLPLFCIIMMVVGTYCK
jgi:hypothetical protein